MNFKINVTLESGTWVAETVGLEVDGEPLSAVGESDASLHQAIVNLGNDIQDCLLRVGEGLLEVPATTTS